MSHSFSDLMDRVLGPYFWARLRREVVGIAQDYWKDPLPETVAQKKQRTELKNIEKKRAVEEKIKAKAQAKINGKAKGPLVKLWAADRPQVLQRMWGGGHVLPGGDAFTDILMRPVGLTGEMSLMDLSAGLGGLARKIVADSGAYVTGLEPDPDLARIGMLMSLAAGKVKQASIAAYDPAQFEADRPYDAVVARELFYRIVKKGPFFTAIGKAVKSRGHMAFTDYILDDPALRQQPQIAAWLAHEPHASPLTMAEMIGVFKINRFDVRINEDQTAFYRHEIAEGLLQFSEFLSENKPDPATVQVILNEVNLWQKRVEAFDHGLKFFRFYAIKL